MNADAAVGLLTAGVGLIYYELNRPGSIVPGAAGLLAVLLALAALGGQGVNSLGLLLIIAAVGLLAADLVRPTAILFAIAATVTLCFGLWMLPAHGGISPVHLPVAAACGVLLGAGTSLLTRIARRARINKGFRLMGDQRTVSRSRRP
jgi:membrane-bound serine protease (ClpP class)